MREGWGLTTGTCAAAAAKAAAMVLAGGLAPSEVEVPLPGGGEQGEFSGRACPALRERGNGRVRVPILFARQIGGEAALAAVRKDAGQDPDVTHGMEVLATVAWQPAGAVMLAAGEGVGTVTKPGLQVPPGQPAINPVPRQMIAAAVREVTARGVRIEIAIPGGRQVAGKTFNPRLGIEGGLSILGTTGFVRPRCAAALHEALRCALRVAAACGVKAPVLVPGNIGARAARQHFALREEQVIEAGNAWGFLLDAACGLAGDGGPHTGPHPNPLPTTLRVVPGEGTYGPSPLSRGEGICAFDALLLVGHPGKLAKLAAGQWDTHSSRSAAATEYLHGLWPEISGSPAARIRSSPSPPARLPKGEGRIGTVEGLLASLATGQREALCAALAQRVRQAVARRIRGRIGVAVLLVDMSGRRLGADGDFSAWQA